MKFSVGDRVAFLNFNVVNLGRIDVTREDGQHHVVWDNGDVLEPEIAWFSDGELLGVT